MDARENRHILYAGGTRWSRISEYKYGDVYVYILYSLTDAAEAVRQHGEHLGMEHSHGTVEVYIPYSLTDAAEAVHPDGQQLVTLRRDRGTRQLGAICFYTHRLDVHSMWGDPPHDKFLSTTPWSDLVLNVSEWPVTANKLTLEFHDVFAHGVVGFLECLQMERTQAALTRLLVQHEGGQLRIEVYKGHIDSCRLLAWTDWYLHQDLLQVQLQLLTCQISGSDPASRRQQQTWVDRLQHTVHNGCKLFVTLM